MRINNPKGEKVFEKAYKTDDFGGLAGEWELAKDATLGVYQSVPASHVNGGVSGGGNFRVEEYKKPEFEVTVEAPKSR